METPSKGWGAEVIDATDMRLGDDIERIRILRNKLCHTPMAVMTQTDFTSVVKEMKDIMHRWSNETGMSFVSDIDKVVNNTFTITELNKIVNNFITETQRAISEDAYSSGHLVLSHFGTCMCSNVETNLS